jgi:hypothetical protein
VQASCISGCPAPAEADKELAPVTVQLSCTTAPHTHALRDDVPANAHAHAPGTIPADAAEQDSEKDCRTDSTAAPLSVGLCSWCLQLVRGLSVNSDSVN